MKGSIVSLFKINVNLHYDVCIILHIHYYNNHIDHLTCLLVHRSMCTLYPYYVCIPYELYISIVLYLLLTVILHVFLCHKWPTQYKYIYVITMISIAIENILYIMLTFFNGTLILKQYVISVRVWRGVYVHTHNICMVICILYALFELIRSELYTTMLLHNAHTCTYENIHCIF